MEGLIRKHRPILLTEFFPAVIRYVGKTEPLDYLRWFEERGYALHIIEETGGSQQAQTAEGIMARFEDPRLYLLDLAAYPDRKAVPDPTHRPS